MKKNPRVKQDHSVNFPPPSSTKTSRYGIDIYSEFDDIPENLDAWIKALAGDKRVLADRVYLYKAPNPKAVVISHLALLPEGATAVSFSAEMHRRAFRHWRSNLGLESHKTVSLGVLQDIPVHVVPREYQPVPPLRPMDLTYLARLDDTETMQKAWLLLLLSADFSRALDSNMTDSALLKAVHHDSDGYGLIREFMGEGLPETVVLRCAFGIVAALTLIDANGPADFQATLLLENLKAFVSPQFKTVMKILRDWRSRPPGRERRLFIAQTYSGMEEIIVHSIRKGEIDVDWLFSTAKGRSPESPEH